MKYQTISLKHTFAGEDKTYYVEIAMVIFFLYKNNILFLCVNKSHEAYLGFHRCLQNIIYFLPGLTKSLGLVDFQAGQETIKIGLTNGERSRHVIFQLNY